MALYTHDSKQRVRDAVDFVDLVSARTDLRRAGPSRYEGLCPFHDERTPSFGINPSEKLYHCFGCGASGDVFNFVMNSEGLDFKGALEWLAERTGVELEREAEDPKDVERRLRRERLHSLLARTADYYQRYLWASTEARAARSYLEGRGLQEGMLREFRVGYAPSQWNRVLDASLRAGFKARELYEVGLVQRSGGEGRVYDRFRERIVFPLADLRGRVIGFGARAMRERQGPKYLNTSDNEIYHKGRHLYGADLARPHATRAGAVIVCEGYTDVIAMHQAGLRNSVGLMGTALTADQVDELARLASVVLLALDADGAGHQAMLRADSLARKRRIELRVVALPKGSDPADLLAAEGPGAMNALVEASVPFARFRVDQVLLDGDHSRPEGRDRMLEALRPTLAELPPSALREELLRLIADRLDLSPALVGAVLAAPTSALGRASDSAGAAGTPRVSAAAALGGREQEERSFLALCIALPEAGGRALARLDPAGHFTSDLLRRAAAHLRTHLGAPAEGLPEGDPHLATLIAELSVRAGAERPAPATLEAQALRLELAALDRQIQAARARASGEVAELGSRRAKLKASFDAAAAIALERE